MTQRIQVRRGTAAAATAANPVLADGEIGFETDTGKAKIGDGATAWNSLAYFGAAADLAAHLANTSDAHDASAISYAGSTSLAATDVEAALDELDTEKAATGHSHGLPVLDGCQIKTSADLNVSTAIDTYVPCGLEDFDTAGYHDNVTNNSRITIPAGKGGRYLVTVAMRYGANSTGERSVGLHLNGANFALAYTRLGVGGSVNFVALSHTRVLDLVPGDYLQALAWQNSGSTLTIPAQWAMMTALRLGS